MKKYALAAASTLLLTLILWLFRETLTLANFSLIYLLLVVIVSTRLGIRAGILTTLLSFAAFNFFLVDPVYTFRVAASRELLDLFIFLAVAFITGTMAAQRIELAERTQRARSLEEADALKTALLRAVSHDLRTPITIIKTSVSNLLTLPLGLAEQRDMLQTIEAEADTLNKLVGNLLDMSRLEAGVLQMNLAWNSLEEIAGDVAARFWKQTQTERIALDFPVDFPLARFDYGLILQAVSNIVENAIRYEPPGSKIQLRGSFQQDTIRLTIMNHGPSIPPEERDKIMEPFYHSTAGGTGLGLAIARGIIEAHHGQIWIEDTPGGGASFIIALPYQELTGEAYENSDC